MSKVNLKRRTFLKGVGAAALVGVAGPAVYGGLVEAWDYELTETVVPVSDLPERFEGFRIAQVSDVHHGRLVPIEEVRRVVGLANAARADMIALTGDYTTQFRQYVEPCADALAELNAPESPRSPVHTSSRCTCEEPVPASSFGADATSVTAEAMLPQGSLRRFEKWSLERRE